MRKDIRIRISSGNLVPLLLKLELEQRPGALARHRRPDDRVLLGRQTLWRQRDGPPRDRDRDREPLASRRGPWTGSSTDARLDPGASQTRSGVPREREGSGARPQPSSGESSERERSSDRSGRERSSFWALNFVSASERGGPGPPRAGAQRFDLPDQTKFHVFTGSIYYGISGRRQKDY